MRPDRDKIAKLAKTLSAAFHAGERESRDTGRLIRILKDGHPEWMTDVCHAAHGDMLPDDFRYELIEEACEALAEAEGDVDEAREQLPEPPIYNSERLRWLGSHLERAGYCDEACHDFGVSADTGILDRIAIGYRAEQEEVLAQVARALADVEDDEPETEAQDETTEAQS